MAEVEESIAVYVGFGDMEISADQRDKERVEEPVDKFQKQLCSFVNVRFGKLGVTVLIWQSKPGYGRNLNHISVVCIH